MAESRVILKVDDLTKLFPIRGGPLKAAMSKGKFIRAVDGVSFQLRNHEILGLVGESGCGKTTTGRLVLNLAKATKGRVFFEGLEVSDFTREQHKHFRRKAQMIFQDPYAAADPRRTVSEIVSDPIRIHHLVHAQHEENEIVAKGLQSSGLQNVEEVLTKYPHELSGGQLQRVLIARAIVLQPDLIVADEPVSMLDVSVRMGILNLLLGLKEELHLACLFITHDLAIARYVCDRIVVMYLGRIVEEGTTEEVLQKPKHPYTAALLASVPSPDPRTKSRTTNVVPEDTSEVSALVDTGSGRLDKCLFEGRCPYARDLCRSKEPPLREVSKNHFAACHFAEELSL